MSDSKVIDPRADLSADPSTNTLAEPRTDPSAEPAAPRTAALGISPSNEHPADSLLARQTALRWISSRFVPAGVGILATLISVMGSWIPSYWSDEAASVMSAQRTWPQLFNMLGNIDIVLARSVLDHHTAGLYSVGSLITRAVQFAPQFLVVSTFTLFTDAAQSLAVLGGR